MRIWSWQHVSVNISSVAELSPVYCCLVSPLFFFQCFHINISLAFFPLRVCYLHCFPIVSHSAAVVTREERKPEEAFHRLQIVKKCFSSSHHSHSHAHWSEEHCHLGPRAEAPKKSVPKISLCPSLTTRLSPARRHWPNWAKLTAAATILRPKLGPQPPQAPAPPTTRRFPRKIFRYFSQIFVFWGNVF